MKNIGVIGLKGLPALGGTAVVGENIIKQLNNKYQFTVYAISSHTDPGIKLSGINQIVFKKFPIKKLNILYYYLASAIHALFKGNYDFIHLHLIDGAFILPIIRIKYKVISTSHGRPHTVGKWNLLIRWFFLLNERIFLNFSNIITSVSLPLIDDYKKFSKKKIHYISNGINLTDSTEIQTKKNSDYLLFAARRIIECKGAHIFLNALKSIDFKGNVKIIGELDQVNTYKEEILELSKGLNVEFIGLITDKEKLFEYIRASRVFIFPSLQEAMSIMLLEVASMSTPIICSDIAANKAVFSDDEITFFKSGDFKDLAKKITEIDNNYDIAINKAELALSCLKNNYTWNGVGNKYVELYEQI